VGVKIPDRGGEEPGFVRCWPEADADRRTKVGGCALQTRRDLLEVLDDRCGRAATLVTSQFPVGEWHGLIGEATVADAILDRLIHGAYRIELQGESMRKRYARADGDSGNGEEETASTGA
jgi:hypothetical protein